MRSLRSRILVGCLGVSALLASGAALAQSAPPPSGAPSAAGPATADSMSALTQEIRSLNSDITGIVQQISQLEFAKPAPLAKDASDDARKQYAQALAAWEKQRKSLQGRIDQLSARVKELQARLEKLSSTLPASQSTDREKNEKALRDAQKRLDQARTSLSSSANAVPAPKKPANQPGTGLPTPAPGAGPTK